jgi:uncharacterized membrane protein
MPEERNMAMLTVWRFKDAEGAERAASTLADLQAQGLIVVHDAATVSWPMARKRPRTRQLHNLAGSGALSGSFWGLLFGLLFFVPLFGMAVGAALGAVGGSLADIGIDDDFIDSVRSEVQPGTSALFVLTSDAVPEKVHDAFASERPQLVHTNLTSDQEARLREYFADA